jgi:endogenous inhibitor of DNA gyrase (YacG/DUF329 family)
MPSSESAANPPRIVLCPTCGKRVKWTAANPVRPFCSERCRMIDLGAWADERNRIPGNPEEDDLLSEDPDRG